MVKMFGNLWSKECFWEEESCRTVIIILRYGKAKGLLIILLSAHTFKVMRGDFNWRPHLVCSRHVNRSSVVAIFVFLGVLQSHATNFYADRNRFEVSSPVFYPRAGPSLQTQTPRLQFCPNASILLQTQEPRLQFY